MPGQFVLTDFVDEAEEAELLSIVDNHALPWQASRLNGPSRCDFAPPAPAGESLCRAAKHSILMVGRSCLQPSMERLPSQPALSHSACRVCGGIG